MKINKIYGFIKNSFCKEIIIMDRFGLLRSNKIDREQISQMQGLGYIIFFESFGKRISWREIDELYRVVQPFLTFINTEDPVFLQNHDDMPQLIRNYCSQNNMPVPQSIGEISRCIYESLVMAVKHYFKLLVKY